MQIDPEEQARSEADYAAAFEEIDPAMAQVDQEPGEQAVEQPADAANTPVDIAASVDAGVADTAAAGTPAGQTAVEAQGDQVDNEAEPVRAGGESGEQAVEAAQADDEIEKERQRLRSWEGRLKKAEADLKAKTDAAAATKPEANGPVNDGSNTESTTSSALENLSNDAAGDGNTELGEAAQQAADAVASGDLTPEQAMRQLAEDFGEDFVRMIEVIASAKAKAAGADAAAEKVGEIGKTVEELVADVSDSKAKAHFRAIGKAHPDFIEVGQSEGFRDFIGGLDEKAKADAERVVKTGTAAEIVKLLDGYKEARKAKTEADLADDPRPAADPVVEQQMDAAEGVRSTGMSLPAQPRPSATSYEEAWAEF